MRYKVIFDEYNINWSDSMEQNVMFLRQQAVYYNDLLRINKFVSLGEILKNCFRENNIPKETFLYGWDWGKSGHITFDVFHHSNGIEIIFHAPDSIFGINNPYAGKEIKSLFIDEFGTRKENNMGPEKKTTGILYAAFGDPRGPRTIELKIKKVIFNDPATIVFWSDGTKTVVKCGANDAFDPEKGLAMAISKKFLGNNYKAYGRFKKWLPKEYGEKPLPEKIGSGSVPWNQLTKENKDNAAH